jgi:hypothetical protein
MNLLRGRGVRQRYIEACLLLRISLRCIPNPQRSAQYENDGTHGNGPVSSLYRNELFRMPSGHVLVWSGPGELFKDRVTFTLICFRHRFTNWTTSTV